MKCPLTLEFNISQPQNRCDNLPDRGHFSWGELQNFEGIRYRLVVVFLVEHLLASLIRVVVFARVSRQIKLLQLIVTHATK